MLHLVSHKTNDRRHKHIRKVFTKVTDKGASLPVDFI